MNEFITLRRELAANKLASAKSARYYFQRGKGNVYYSPIEVEAVVAVVRSDPRARCRVRLSDSQHVVVMEESTKQRSGYEVCF